MTLRLLWEQYQALSPKGYAYSHFCDLYKQWQQSLDVVMRQEHRAREKLFTDFAGATVTVWEPRGEREAPLFVAALGASSYTYEEAVWAQDLENWTICMWALEWSRGSQCILVPDNVEAAVSEAHRQASGWLYKGAQHIGAFGDSNWLEEWTFFGSESDYRVPEVGEGGK